MYVGYFLTILSFQLNKLGRLLIIGGAGLQFLFKLPSFAPYKIMVGSIN